MNESVFWPVHTALLFFFFLNFPSLSNIVYNTGPGSKFISLSFPLHFTQDCILCSNSISLVISSSVYTAPFTNMIHGRK